MAQHWRGWDGTKHWQSIESDFELRCTSDGLGHVVIEVTLRSGPYEEDWAVRAPIHLDAGDLEAIAARVKTLLHA
jgi:hypothetical protein